MKLQIRNSRSRILDCEPNVQDKLVDLFTITDPDTGLPFTLYDRDNNTFPTGLLSEAYATFRFFGSEPVIEDQREEPVYENSQIAVGIPLREEYQVPDLWRMLHATRGIVKWPTGGGKTLLACHYIAERGLLPVVFYVNRASLMLQTVEVFKSVFDDKLVGCVGDGTCSVRPITVAMVQSTHSAIKANVGGDILQMVEDAKVILVDECHHVPANSIFDIVRRSRQAYHRFGFSATPFRADGLDLLITAALGPRVCDRSASELYELGYLLNADIRLREVPPAKWRPGWEVWHKAYSDYIVRNSQRNDLIVGDVVEDYWDGRRIVVFVNQLKHGRILTSLIRERLPSQEVIFVEGELPIDLRKEIFRQVRSGEIRVMVVTPLGDEGLDIPEVDSIVLADGGRSPVEKIQQIGRGLRPPVSVDGLSLEERRSLVHKDCLVHDYYDQAPMFGKHAEERIQLYRTIETHWRVSRLAGSHTVDARRVSGEEVW